MPAKKKTTKATKADSKQKGSVQPEVNIGLVGHVDHGKTTLTERLTAKWTDTHSEEMKRGITIRLGYADSAFYYNKKADLYSSTTEVEGHKAEDFEQQLKVSFVDAPGHESLMATMLSGAAVMDAALLLVAANEECPQPQTREHLMALEIADLKNIIIVQNKVDLVSREQAKKNFDQIKAFVKGTIAQDAPIVPISAQFGLNVDLLIKLMIEKFTVPDRDPKKEPLMFVARSFDVNKPGYVPKKLVGGVLGGALAQGVFKVGDDIEIRPGRRIEKEGRVQYLPIESTIFGLKTGGTAVEEVVPGGSIGVMTYLDPSLVKSDGLAGSVVGHKGKLPPVWQQLQLETHLLERVVGTKEEADVEPIKKGEILMLNANSAATVGQVTELGKDTFKCILKLPICASIGARVTISRRLGNRFRLIGYGLIKE